MTINSVDKAITLLNCFSSEEPVLSVGSIAKTTGNTPSTVSRLMSTMEKRGVVEKAPGHGRYRLGSQVYLWGLLSSAHHELTAMARSEMEELRDRCGEEVSLHIVLDDHRTCLERVPSRHAIAMTGTTGGRLPLHAGASGRVLLAFMEPEIRDAILEGRDFARFTPNTLTERDRLEAELQNTREQGYAVSKEEREPGAYSVVAPIRDSDGRVVASLAIAGPLYRLDDDRLERHVADVQTTAASISGKLGYR